MDFADDERLGEVTDRDKDAEDSKSFFEVSSGLFFDLCLFRLDLEDDS